LEDGELKLADRPVLRFPAITVARLILKNMFIDRGFRNDYF
jgi:hypothetical protein